MVPDRDAPLRPSPAAGPPAADAPASIVAVVRSDNRRGATAEALALLDAEIRPILSGPAVVLIHLEGGRADPSALSSLIDSVLAGGPDEVLVASGDEHAGTRFDRAGFRRECWGRPVRFLDLGKDEEHWRSVERPGIGPIRIAGTLATAGCRIALTPIASVDGRRGHPAGRRAMLAAIHPDDRSRFDGVPIRRAWPDLSIIEGPVGRAFVAVAGIDPTAVDAAAAAILGRPFSGPFGEPAPFAVIGDPIEHASHPARRPAAGLSRGFRRDAGHGNPEGGS